MGRTNLVAPARGHFEEQPADSGSRPAPCPIARPLVACRAPMVRVSPHLRSRYGSRRCSSRSSAGEQPWPIGGRRLELLREHGFEDRRLLGPASTSSECTGVPSGRRDIDGSGCGDGSGNLLIARKSSPSVSRRSALVSFVRLGESSDVRFSAVVAKTTPVVRPIGCNSRLFRISAGRVISKTPAAWSFK